MYQKVKCASGKLEKCLGCASAMLWKLGPPYVNIFKIYSKKRFGRSNEYFLISIWKKLSCSKKDLLLSSVYSLQIIFCIYWILARRKHNFVTILIDKTENQNIKIVQFNGSLTSSILQFLASFDVKNLTHPPTALSVTT